MVEPGRREGAIKTADGRDQESTTRSVKRPRYRLPRVLIVDDAEDNRDLFALVLGNAGFEVDVAEDGIQGVMMARELRPAIIIMDLAMPQMDGFSATRQIRADATLAHVYIIAVTAFIDRMSEEQALAAGCNEVLTKPCFPQMLVATVGKGLRMARAAASPPSSRAIARSGSR